ncbi:alpha/beta hydrolase [Macrococcoides caseolyticum]|uniref:alpha/beta hydrolase n=1 Tax=Macrococcoides caseolyticum TaxID=69966 RepID=UPI001F3B0729|nr:alpha/beta hydrolase [Macrococcus caseolyticus]MCE4956520.1 alpha/beta hydrolase [Macrococcus caseolyticus]
MTIQSILFNAMIKIMDQYKDYFNQQPEGIRIASEVEYSQRHQNNTLNIYYPKVRLDKYPVIINVHGGGYVYSNKETYEGYCMTLAEHGFAVVSYDYDLAPKQKYPTPIVQLNECMHWLKNHYEKYQLDIDQLFMVGDSAGAQIMSQYVTLLTSHKYSKHFQFELPNINILGIAINCGFFNAIDIAIAKKKSVTRFMVRGLMEDYVGKDFHTKHKEINFEPYINKNFPATYVASSVNDLLVGKAPDILLYLRRNEVKVIYREYGHSDFFAQHNFQMDIRRPNAKQCTLDEMNFFKGILEESPL